MNGLAAGIKKLSTLRTYHLWLPYTLVWLINPIYQGGAMKWVEFLIAWPLFLGLYAGAHAASRSMAIVSLIGMCMLGAVYVPLNPEASGVFAFAAAILAAKYAIPVLLWGFVLAANVLLLSEALLYHLNLWTWIGGGSGAVIFAVYVLFDSRQREANLQLRLAEGEIARLAKLAERERITRDLHDVLGHTLSLIVMKSELAQKVFATDPAATLAEARQIESISRQALVKVRRAIHGYSDPQFKQELDRIVSVLQSVHIEVEVVVEPDALTTMQESVFGMVLQEAATNVMRHANANRCRIEVFATPVTVNLIVHDDGHGAASYDGFGIRGMRERLTLLGGQLQLSATNGTRLQASLPR